MELYQTTKQAIKLFDSSPKKKGQTYLLKNIVLDQGGEAPSYKRSGYDFLKACMEVEIRQQKPVNKWNFDSSLRQVIALAGSKTKLYRSRLDSTWKNTVNRRLLRNWKHFYARS